MLYKVMLRLCDIVLNNNTNNILFYPAISEDFHAKMLQWEDKKGKHMNNDQISSVFTDEFIRKMDQWEMIKGLNGQAILNY